MLIREAIEADAASITQLLREISELKSVSAQTAEQTHSVVSRALALATSSGASMILIGVTDVGVVAGYCAVHWVPFLFLPGPEAYITELFIRPGDRSSGLGSKLLGEAEVHARKRGCSRLSLLNNRDSESYQRGFYSKRGWVERDRMANFVAQLN
jgi:ribosomal protein S18 acetylase RimI-like enzyme